MFEGLFGPWHLLVVALVVFVVLGPRRISAKLRGTADTVQHWVDPDQRPVAVAPRVVQEAHRPKIFYRLGRRWRRRRQPTRTRTLE